MNCLCVAWLCARLYWWFGLLVFLPITWYLLAFTYLFFYLTIHSRWLSHEEKNYKIFTDGISCFIYRYKICLNAFSKGLPFCENFADYTVLDQKKNSEKTEPFFLLLPQILMKTQWLRYTSEIIIFLDYCCQNFLYCSKKSYFSKKKILKNTQNWKFLRIFFLKNYDFLLQLRELW